MYSQLCHPGMHGDYESTTNIMPEILGDTYVSNMHYATLKCQIKSMIIGITHQQKCCVMLAKSNPSIKLNAVSTCSNSHNAKQKSMVTK